MKQNVLKKSDLKSLLENSNDKATIGLESGSANQITPLPSFPYADNVVIYKLEQLNKLSGNINGTYQISGIKNQTQYLNFMTKLANVSGQTLKELKTPASSRMTYRGVFSDNLLMSGIICFFLLTSFLAFFLLQKFQKLGTLAMLGWTKGQILRSEFKAFICFGTIIAATTALIAGFSFPEIFYLACLPFLLLSQVFSLLLVLLSFLIASLTVLFGKNIDLIKNRFPPKTLIYCSNRDIYSEQSGNVSRGHIH